MYPAAVVVQAAADHTSTAPTGPGSMAVAVVGALSLVVVALIPELFKALRPATAPVPPEVVTPAALDAAKAELRAEVRAAVAPVEAAAARADREVRAFRRAAEAREDVWRDRLEKLRDELQEHMWRQHAERPPPIPEPRQGEPV